MICAHSKRAQVSTPSLLQKPLLNPGRNFALKTNNDSLPAILLKGSNFPTGFQIRRGAHRAEQMAHLRQAQSSEVNQI